MADCPRLEMHVSIAAISVPAGSILKIADHGKCHAGITRQVLPQTKSCRHQALVPCFDSFQLCMLRPEAINTQLQAFDAMDVKIKMDVTMCSEIGEERSEQSSVFENSYDAGGLVDVAQRDATLRIVLFALIKKGDPMDSRPRIALSNSYLRFYCFS